MAWEGGWAKVDSGARKIDTNLNFYEFELLEAMPDAALVVDAITECVVAANERTCEMSGFTLSELRGKKVSDVQCKDGSSLDIEFHGGGFKRSGRQYRMGTARRVKSPERDAIWESDSQDRYHELFENANDFIYTHDLQGRLTSVNRAALRTLGYTLEEATGLSVFTFVDEKYIPIAQFNTAEKLRTGRATPPYELLCKSRDGRPIWLEVSTRIITHNGAPAEVQGIGRDITERKTAELALKESRRQLSDQKNLLEEMIRQNPYAIGIWNPDGSFNQANEMFVKLFGALPPPGYNFLKDAQMTEAGHMEKLKRALRGETIDIERAEYDIGKSPASKIESHPVSVSIKMFPVLDDEGKVIVLVVYYEDLAPKLEADSHRKKLEEQLLQAQKVDAIGQLAGGVAHDFNNLLTGVIGYLDLVESMCGPEVKPLIHKAGLAVQRGTDLTRKLLAYARKSPIEPQAMDLNETVHEVSALIRQTVDKKIEIIAEPGAQAATINADPSQMSQVLMNFSLNARDSLNEKISRAGELGLASENWKPSIKISTRLETITADYCRRSHHAREGYFVRLSVSDNGMGIDESVRQRIFDPFFTTKPKGQGTGLGLSTVLGIVKQHEGWIELYSEPGKHTVFHVLLPATERPAIPLSTAAASMTVRGGKETVLLADDEEMIRELAKDMLEDRGYEVLLAIDGQEALEIFEREKSRIDLVVLDLTMPRMSGNEILPKLLAMKPNLKVIASSGYSYDDNWHDLQSNGAAAFVQKPYTALDFARVVRQVLDSRS